MPSALEGCLYPSWHQRRMQARPQGRAVQGQLGLTSIKIMLCQLTCGVARCSLLAHAFTAKLARLVYCRSVVHYDLVLSQAASKFVPTTPVTSQKIKALMCWHVSTQCSKVPSRYTRAREAQVCASRAHPCTRFAKYLNRRAGRKRNKVTTPHVHSRFLTHRVLMPPPPHGS